MGEGVVVCVGGWGGGGGGVVDISDHCYQRPDRQDDRDTSRVRHATLPHMYQMGLNRLFVRPGALLFRDLFGRGLEGV